MSPAPPRSASSGTPASCSASTTGASPGESKSATAQGTNGRSEPRPERGRFSSRRKAEAVLRLLHGEELDALSRELGVTAATLAQ